MQCNAIKIQFVSKSFLIDILALPPLTSWACARSHILYRPEVCIQCNSAKLHIFGPSSLQQGLIKAYIIRKECYVSRWQQTGMSCGKKTNAPCSSTKWPYWPQIWGQEKKFWFVAQQIPCGHDWLSENKLSVLFMVRMVTGNSPLRLWFFRFLIVLHYFCDINQCKQIQTWNIICAPSWVDFLMQPMTLQPFSSQLKANGSFQKTRHTLQSGRAILQDQGI